jgi:hypothetical protein
VFVLEWQEKLVFWRHLCRYYGKEIVWCLISSELGNLFVVRNSPLMVTHRVGNVAIFQAVPLDVAYGFLTK